MQQISDHVRQEFTAMGSLYAQQPQYPHPSVPAYIGVLLMVRHAATTHHTVDMGRALAMLQTASHTQYMQLMHFSI